MNYSVIKPLDIANGPGIRVSLFVSGCRNHCPHCFQPETWSFNYGTEFTQDNLNEIIQLLKHPHVHGLTVLGGEPMEPENQKDLVPILKAIRNEVGSKINIWCYTGFYYEDLTENRLCRGNCGETTAELLDQIDVLVDGPFIEEMKNLGLRFRGSSNQRLIDLKKTRECGEIVSWFD